MNAEDQNLSLAAEKLVREIGIPPCPQVLSDFMSEVRSDDADVHKLSHLISRDVALASAMLATANSPFFGLRNKAKTVHSALFALGIRNAAHLIAGLLLRRAFASIAPAIMNHYWDSTSRIGMIAAFVGRELGIADLHQAHTFALFRDCGSPLLMQKFPDYGSTVEAAEHLSGPDLIDAEQQRYAVDHAAVGATLAANWYLPDEIARSIELHHSEPRQGEIVEELPPAVATLVALGSLAEVIYRTHRATQPRPAMEAALERACARLTIRPGDLEPLQADIEHLLV